VGGITSTLPPGHGAAPYGQHPTRSARRRRWLRSPAIVTQLDATTLVAEGWRVRMDTLGTLILGQ
jgi:hypothetical protein